MACWAAAFKNSLADGRQKSPARGPFKKLDGKPRCLSTLESTWHHCDPTFLPSGVARLGSCAVDVIMNIGSLVKAKTKRNTAWCILREFAHFRPKGIGILFLFHLISLPLAWSGRKQEIPAELCQQQESFTPCRCQSQCLSYSLSVWRNFNWITKKQTIIREYPTKQLNLMFIYAHLCTLVKNCQQYPSIFKKLMLLRPCLHWQPFLDSWPRCVPSHQWSCWRPCPAATCSNMLPSIKPSWVIRYEHHLPQKSLCAFFPLPLFSASSAASRTAFAAFISLVETNSLLIRNVTLSSMWLKA